jgi:hypothetical protein
MLYTSSAWTVAVAVGIGVLYMRRATLMVGWLPSDISICPTCCLIVLCVGVMRALVEGCWVSVWRSVRGSISRGLNMV